MKISSRDRKLLGVFVFGVLAYVVFAFYIEPILEEMAEVEEEKQLLAVEVNDVGHLEEEVRRLSDEEEQVGNELQRMLDTQNFETMSPSEMLDYIGNYYLEYGVEAESFQSKEIVDKGSYWEVPYVIHARGDMLDLVRFVNSLYKIDKYFFISDINLEQRDVPSMYLRVRNPGITEIGFEWGEDFASKLYDELPLDEILAEETAFSTEVSEEIHLTFKIHFISLDGEVRD